MKNWSLNEAATEFGVSRETVKRGLRGNDINVSPSKKYTTRQIFTALAGDLKFERTRRERAAAEALERENKIAAGELHCKADITKAIWTECLAPLRAELLTLHQVVGPRCVNATEAEEVLKSWVDSILKKINPHE